MKVEIRNWEESELIRKIVLNSIKKFRFVREREQYLKNMGLNVKFSYLRVYKGIGNYEDFYFPKEKTIERRIIVGRPYNNYDGFINGYRPSRSAVCVIVKANVNELNYKLA